MKQKRYIKYFIIVSIILIAILPSYNFYQYAKKYDFSKLFNTDKIESYRNYIVYKLFNQSMESEKVITGKDGFLFLGNQYNDILHKTNGRLQYSEKQIDHWTDRLQKLQQWYENQGIKFIMVIVPNKHTIYKEKLPNWMQYSGKTITDDIIKFSKSKSINLLDLRPALLKNKKNDNLLYFKTDTHWTNLSIGLAYSKIIQYINSVYSINLSTVNYNIKNDFRGSGDLASFLKINNTYRNNYENRYQFVFKKSKILLSEIDKKSLKLLNRSKYILNRSIYINKKAYQIENNTSLNAQKLLLLCDSFASNKRGDVGTSVLFNESFQKIWQWHYSHLWGEKLSNFLKIHRPNIVIYQVVERSLYTNRIVASLPIIKRDQIKVIDNKVVSGKKIFDFKLNTYYFNNNLVVMMRKNYIEINATKKDPSIILNQTKTTSKNVVLSCSIESPHKTRFQIFYKENSDSSYSERDSYSVVLKKGINNINLLIPSKYINSNLR
ncbi:MAG: hypothetical protein U9N49_09040, partial [Campylobacterota bacterium]|nr:hypothetical protein [Campylobacterota bacterium]